MNSDASNYACISWSVTQYLLFSNIYLTVYVQCLASNSVSISNCRITTCMCTGSMQDNGGGGGRHKERRGNRGRRGREWSSCTIVVSVPDGIPVSSARVFLNCVVCNLLYPLFLFYFNASFCALYLSVIRTTRRSAETNPDRPLSLQPPPPQLPITTRFPRLTEPQNRTSEGKGTCKPFT